MSKLESYIIAFVVVFNLGFSIHQAMEMNKIKNTIQILVCNSAENQQDFRECKLAKRLLWKF